MMTRLSTALCVLLAACGGDEGGAGDASLRDGATGDAAPSADATPPDLPDAAPPRDPLVGIGTATLVQGNFQFLEGPVWRAADGVLLFSDIPANTIHRLTPPAAIDVFRGDSGNANGLVSDHQGLLLAAEHGNRRVSRTLATGEVVEVAGSYQGKSLNSPNDIAVRTDGTIYFTDPPYGINGSQQELSFNGVFRVDTTGVLTAEWEGALTSRPNGIHLSPDQRTLYVADTTGPVRAYDVAPSGGLSGERTFSSDVAGADGLCMDEDGNVFVTTSSGVKAFSRTGSLWGTIVVAEQPANCTFGGSDYRTMYITARTGLYRVDMVVPGLR